MKSKEEKIRDLYHEYIKEACNIQDITRWSTKRTITASVLNPERTNEQKVFDAIQNEDSLQEGDKLRFFFKSDQSLELEKNFNGDYCLDTMLEKVFKTVMIFQPVIPNVKELCLNYSLKRSKIKLKELLDAKSR